MFSCLNELLVLRKRERGRGKKEEGTEQGGGGKERERGGRKGGGSIYPCDGVERAPDS